MDNLADWVLDFWDFLLFTEEGELNADTAAKMEDALVSDIEDKWTREERQALEEAARRRLEGREPIDPEDESQDRRQRFLSFIASGRVGDLWML